MYQSFEIGSKFRISPPDDKFIDDGHITLLMQRGAFGSGEHETTESCLDVLSGMQDIKGCRVLDLGSGTGILAIAALKLGAEHAVCVDIEADAVENAKINCHCNKVLEQTTHIAGTLDVVRDETFDLVLANIYGDVLLSVAADLAELTLPGGRLLLSGILWEYNFDVRMAYQKRGFDVIRNHMLDEFSTIELIKIR